MPQDRNRYRNVQPEGLTEMDQKVESIHLLKNHICIFTDHLVELKCEPYAHLAAIQWAESPKTSALKKPQNKVEGYLYCSE